MATILYLRRSVWLTMLAIVLAGAAGSGGLRASTPEISAGIAVEQPGMSLLEAQMTNVVGSAPGSTMEKGGLVGVLGGARVKLLASGRHQILLPVPQWTENQIPVCYGIASIPQKAAREYRISQREGSNVVVKVELEGDPAQEVQVSWSAIILISGRPSSAGEAVSQSYKRETPCVQAGAQKVRDQAEKLWPADGQIGGYAENIQEFIRDRKQEKQPRSLDALGILESGGNWICTANANLATALLRARGICARSVAVVPLNGQRLEMHRIVEYADGSQWRSFDPSLVNEDIPLKPWQNVVMAKTTLADERMAMEPRMGSALGCPYGQELEMLDDGVTLWGEDFFWTLGKPLAGFEASDEALKMARAEWRRFLDTGKLSQTQRQVISATNNAGFLEAMSAKAPEPGGSADRDHAVRQNTNQSAATGASH